MFAAFLLGQTFGQAQFFQPHIPGSLYRGETVSQGFAVPIAPQSMPVQMVPLAVPDALSQQLIRLGQDDRDDYIREPSFPYALTVVCALAVAGAAVQVVLRRRIIK